MLYYKKQNITKTYTVIAPSLKFSNFYLSSALREEWIRGKYERLEFQDPEKQDYLRGNKEGFLMKLGKDTTTKFNRRRFILSETEGTLKYYNKEDVSFFSRAFSKEQSNLYSFLSIFGGHRSFLWGH